MDSLNESETEPLRVNTRKGKKEGKEEERSQVNSCVYTIEREKIEKFRNSMRILEKKEQRRRISKGCVAIALKKATLLFVN